MKRARVIVLAIALTAALGAAWIAKRIVSGPREVQEVEKTVGAVDVLVAAKDINLGDSVGAADLKWQQWPAEGLAPGLISKANDPDAENEALRRHRARPVHRRRADQGQKLIKVSEGGVMAAILPSGMRAISTPIREETAAGGFILPNDRVDVILSRRVQVGNQGRPCERHHLAQRPRARHRPVAREQRRREGRERQNRDARAHAASDRDPGARPIVGRHLALVAQPRRRHSRSSVESTAKIGDANSSSVKLLKYGVQTRAFGMN